MSPGRRPGPDASAPDLPAPDLPAPEPPDRSDLDPRTTDTAALAVVLMSGRLEVVGRLVQASNATLLVEASLDGITARGVYKPVRGERPLWDFPHGTLADREVATYLLADAAGWDTVPLTVPRPDGPFGPGSVQLWVDEVDDDPLVDVVEPDDLTDGWLTVLEAENGAGDPLLLVHRDDPRLRRMALLDAVANNADRKGGHVLRGQAGAVRGVDHGLTFNTDDKLRTVLWGWAGQPLGAGERAELDHLADALADGSPLTEMLDRLLRLDEVERTRERVRELRDGGAMPEPSGGWPSIPWPAI